MNQSSAIREALRVYRLTLLVQLTFLSLGLLAVLGLGTPARLGLLMRAAPTLLLALLVLPPWLEGALGQHLGDDPAPGYRRLGLAAGHPQQPPH